MFKINEQKNTQLRLNTGQQSKGYKSDVNTSEQVMKTKGLIPLMKRKPVWNSGLIQMKLSNKLKKDENKKIRKKKTDRSYGSLDFKLKIRFDPEIRKLLSGRLTGDRLTWYMTKGRDILNVGSEYNLDMKQIMMIASQSRQEQTFKLKTVGNFFGIETDDENMGIGLDVSRKIGKHGKASKHAKGHLMDFSKNGKFYTYLYKKSKDKTLSKHERNEYRELKKWIYRRGDIGEESVIRAYIHYIKGEVDPFRGTNKDWKGFNAIDKVLFNKKSNINQFSQAVVSYASVGYGQAIKSFHSETISDFKTLILAQIKRDEQQVILLDRAIQRISHYFNKDESHWFDDNTDSILKVKQEHEDEMDQRRLNLWLLRNRLDQLRRN